MNPPQTPNPDAPRRQGMDYKETQEVQQVHAAIQREKQEPRVGLEPLSIWLIAIYAIAIFFGGAYLGRFSGSFTAEALDPPVHPAYQPPPGATPAGPQGATDTPAERGKKVFSANCATCHQANGQGVAGQYPPLAGSEYVINGTRRPAMIVLKGLEGPLTVKGSHFGTAVMQPWEKTLTDQKIADVLTYIRSEWGNNASPVTPEQIAGLRKELAGHPGSWHEADLQAIPADANLPGGEQGEAQKPGAPSQGSQPPATPGANPPKP
jgi:mono/diheme cytochrome c family protein